jgi:hypothetical protein
MSTSAEGVAQEAMLFMGIARVREVLRVLLFDEGDEIFPDASCKVKFKDGSTIEVRSDSNGILEFPRKVQGEIEIEILQKTAI